MKLRDFLLEVFAAVAKDPRLLENDLRLCGVVDGEVRDLAIDAETTPRWGKTLASPPEQPRWACFIDFEPDHSASCKD